MDILNFNGLIRLRYDIPDLQLLVEEDLKRKGYENIEKIILIKAIKEFTIYNSKNDAIHGIEVCTKEKEGL